MRSSGLIVDTVTSSSCEFTCDHWQAASQWQSLPIMGVQEDVSVSPVCQLVSSICACTSTPVWQLLNSTYAVSLVSSDSLKPSECSGITIGTSNGCCRSLPTRPRVALRVPQVHCLWRFRRADYLRHVGALAGVSADFHALSSSSSTLQTLIAGFPSSTAICRRPHLPLVARAFR